MGHAIAQAVISLPPWQPGSHPRSKSCGICDGQSGTRVGFLQVLQFPMPMFIPPSASYSLIIYC
jgi:hypothetical protein